MLPAILGAVGLVHSITSTDRANRQTAQANAMQNQINQASMRLDNEKFRYAKQRDRIQDEQYRTRLQTLLKDANAAGIPISTALGAAGSPPTSVSIPGHSTQRVAGTGRTINPDIMPYLQQIGNAYAAKKTENDLIRDTNAAFESGHNAAYAHYRMLNEQYLYNQNINRKPEGMPKKYDLYIDNTQEAINHIKAGGFAIPAGASMEMPEAIGAYHFGKPYGQNYTGNFFGRNKIPELDLTLSP
jgi:type II secretory pathway pseudopilin PulG